MPPHAAIVNVSVIVAVPDGIVSVSVIVVVMGPVLDAGVNVPVIVKKLRDAAPVVMEVFLAAAAAVRLVKDLKQRQIGLHRESHTLGSNETSECKRTGQN